MRRVPDARTATMSWVVTVSEQRHEAMTGVPAIEYASPPHESEQQARALIALMTDGGGIVGAGPWRRGIAGGQRTIELHPSYTGNVF